jgi:hypothetical protein
MEEFSTAERSLFLRYRHHHVKKKQETKPDVFSKPVLRIWIRIHRIHMFLGLPDPDPSVIKQK